MTDLVATAGAQAPRTLAEIDAEIKERIPDGEEHSRRAANLERAEKEFASLLVARDRGEPVPAEQIAKAQRAVADSKLEVEANAYTVEELRRQREETQRDDLQAEGRKMLEDEQLAETGLLDARIHLLEKLVAAWSSRDNEYAWEKQRFEIRKQG